MSAAFLRAGETVLKMSMDVSEQVEALRQVERALVMLREHLPPAYHQFLAFPQEQMATSLARLDILCGNGTINAERITKGLPTRVRARGEFQNPDKET